ncbi:MAG TPA: sterol desaturase family protein [Arachidicoccus sp.]
MAKNFLSNSEESTRMFQNGFLENLSKVHFSVPLFIFIPVIGFFVWEAFAALDCSGWYFLEYYVIGLLVWSLTEYILHRYIFHFVPKSSWGLRLHFIFHGVHHDYPKDRLRLVMPPSVSIPLAILFYCIFYFIFPSSAALYCFFPGFLTGYLIYDMLHYAMHHYNFKTSVMKRIKQHHMLHHYQDEKKGFGVSSSLWDIIFISGFPKKKSSAQAQQKSA